MFDPGHPPNQEAKSSAEGNASASKPISAIIRCAESTPNPGSSAKRTTASSCLFSSWASRRSSDSIDSSILVSSSKCNFKICKWMGVGAPRSASISSSRLHFSFSSPNAANWTGSVIPFAKAVRMRRPLAPSRSLITPESLIRISSRWLSIRLCTSTRCRTYCALARASPRQVRCSTPGTKLSISSPARSRRASRLASR